MNRVGPIDISNSTLTIILTFAVCLPGIQASANGDKVAEEPVFAHVIARCPAGPDFQADPCPTPTDQGVGIVERLMYDEKFASYRAEADIDHASVSDIRVLGTEPGDADTCDALNVQYATFLDDPQEQIFLHASYFAIEDVYVAVFTPRLPDDLADEDVIVSGLSLVKILDADLNRITGYAGY